MLRHYLIFCFVNSFFSFSGENLEKVYRIALHVVYLLGAMIVAAFLHAPFLTRSAILGAVPLNLATYLKHGLNASLDFISLTALIVLITASEDFLLSYTLYNTS